jgi:hypothetical protein
MELVGVILDVGVIDGVAVLVGVILDVGVIDGVADWVGVSEGTTKLHHSLIA